MKQKTISTLISSAQQARKKAYAPYSNFYVGAAVMTKQGSIAQGCNIESASYGLTICAERVAIFQAVAQGNKEITDLALVTDNGAFPCGACRQIIIEFCPQASVTIAAGDKIITTIQAEQLLPYAFSNNDLD